MMAILKDFSILCCTSSPPVFGKTSKMFSLVLICMGIDFGKAQYGSTQDFNVRLNDGNSKEGRLEIYYLGIWGTVCDSGFTNFNAGVACASLGFSYTGTVVRNRRRAGTGRIWLDGVKCTGTESGIEQCAHNGWGATNCSHNNDVSIRCACGIRIFSGPTGKISSPNFPRQYATDLDCYNCIPVPSGETIIITFLAFNTEKDSDWVTITCESGNAYRLTRNSGSQLPPVLTVSSCNRICVRFRSDVSTTKTGFSLIYNVTRPTDNVIGGFITKPSNAFPRADKHDPVIFNCTTTSGHLPCWIITSQGSHSSQGSINYTITNSVCEVITSASYSSWFKTETLGPGSCNLIVAAPAMNLHLLAGIVICTDSKSSSARAILAPINLEMRLALGMNLFAIVRDVVRDEEIRISCSAYFSPINSSTSLVFTDFQYVGGPVVQVHILRTYLTSERNDIYKTSSYVLVKAPKEGVIPPYTCNIVCDFYTNISDLSSDSSIELSFSTDPLQVLYWPTEGNMRITGDNNGQIRTPAMLNCSAASNPPATYKWIDERNVKIADGPTITITHGGKYTCNASNIIRGRLYQQSMSITLQALEDETTVNRVVLILLGVSVLTIIIIIVICLCRQQKRTTAATEPIDRTEPVSSVYDLIPYAYSDHYDIIEEETDEILVTNVPSRVGPLPSPNYSGLEPVESKPPCLYSRMEHKRKSNEDEESDVGWNKQQTNPERSTPDQSTLQETDDLIAFHNYLSLEANIYKERAKDRETSYLELVAIKEEVIAEENEEITSEYLTVRD